MPKDLKVNVQLSKGFTDSVDKRIEEKVAPIKYQLEREAIAKYIVGFFCLLIGFLLGILVYWIVTY